MKLPFNMIVETDIEKYRRDTFWSKEPETLAWIESFEDGKTFFDVGANIGLYSLYAASLHPNLQIYAFEPMPSNFIRLLQNKELNGFANLYCFNMAVGRHTKMVELYVPEVEIGKSGAQINSPHNEKGVEFKPHDVYKVWQIEMDDCRLPLFDYIKIDIDGREQEVLNGMGNVLYNDPPSSILIECNLIEGGNTDAFKESMLAIGYTTDNPFNHHPDHSRNRRGGDPENVVFVRKD